LGGIDVLGQRGAGYGEERVRRVDLCVDGLFPGEELRCKEDYHLPWLRRVADSSGGKCRGSTVSQISECCKCVSVTSKAGSDVFTQIR